MSRAERQAKRQRRRVAWIGTHDVRVERALLEAVARGDVPSPPGEVVHVHILHDDDCPHLANVDGKRGPCRCSPDVVPHSRGSA